MKISLVSIPVTSPSQAFKFYTETLGFVKKMYIAEAGIAIVVSPEEVNGTALLLEPNTNPISKTYQTALFEANLPVLVFGVADIKAEFTRLKGLGVVFRGEPVKTDWGTQVLFEDTCGNLVQLHQV
jgi:predicted enzyme related to lactoylglutathione lyase